jgi:uncharacterized oligopeptide transporter (OPT) family protein
MARVIVRSSPSGQPEFTARAVVAGALLGAVFAVGNVYVGLKTGLSDTATMTAAVLGFAIFKTLGKKPYSPLENNITQTVSSSAATMPATMGFLGAFPALGMMGAHYPSWVLLLWGGALGLLGIVLALALRSRFLGDASIPFPDAIATSEIIRVMHKSGAKAVTKARALVAAAFAGGLVAWFRDAKPSLIPGAGYFPFALRGVPAARLSLGVVYSPLLFSLGMLIGPRTGLGLFVGGVVAWGALAPWLVADQVVADAGALRGWLLWPGASLMIAAVLTALARDWRILARSARDVRAVGASFDRRTLVAPAALTALLVMLGSWAFQVNELLLLAALALSVVSAVVVARSIGETACMPLGSIGRLTQLVFAASTQGPVASVVTASIPAGSGGQTGQTLETLKVGRFLGASPQNQIVGQLVGALVGTPCAVLAYDVLSRAYEIGGAELPAPTASPWKVVAELIGQGTAGIPHAADTASIVAAAVGVALTLLERTRIGAFVPSPLGMGLALVLGGAPAFTMAAGALAHALLRRVRPAWTDEYVASIAAGGLVGEALIGVVVATLLVAQVL